MNQNHNLLSAFRNAFQGLWYVFSSQRNAKIHAIITCLVILFSFLLRISLIEWIAILFAIGFVWSSECLNTAVEKITDLVSPEYNGLAKVTKDSAAAGVLISAIIAVCVGLIIFLPKILAFLF
ncbi:MAG: diacylglycerol kinase family protein [Anaerolineaceae bacterium]